VRSTPGVHEPALARSDVPARDFAAPTPCDLAEHPGRVAKGIGDGLAFEGCIEHGGKQQPRLGLRWRHELGDRKHGDRAGTPGFRGEIDEPRFGNDGVRGTEIDANSVPAQP
jgi:hypothetical protein